jgi:hypothetical protein
MTRPDLSKPHTGTLHTMKQHPVAITRALPAIVDPPAQPSAGTAANTIPLTNPARRLVRIPADRAQGRGRDTHRDTLMLRLAVASQGRAA